MAIHILDYAVIICLIAPMLIIGAKFYHDKSVPMKWFTLVITTEILLQKVILLNEGEWFLPNFLIHIFFIWPLVLAFYMQKAQLSTLKELIVFTKPMNQTALFVILAPIVIYAATVPFISQQVKEQHKEMLDLLIMSDNPYELLLTSNADASLIDLPQKAPLLKDAKTRVLVYPHMALVIVTGDNWREEFTYFRSHDQWQLTSNSGSSFINPSE